jgi:hypothetical protein
LQPNSSWWRDFPLMISIQRPLRLTQHTFGVCWVSSFFMKWKGKYTFHELPTERIRRILVDRTNIFGRPAFPTSGRAASIEMGRCKCIKSWSNSVVSQIEHSLNLIFCMRPPVRHLREIIPRLKQIVNSPAPKTRRQGDIIEWMAVTWDHIEPTLHEIARERGLIEWNRGMASSKVSSTHHSEVKIHSELSGERWFTVTFLCWLIHWIIFNWPAIDDLSCRDGTASVENRCALPVKLAENHRKTRGKFLVKHGMMRVKLAKNHGQMQRRFARNRGMMRVEFVENCKRMRGYRFRILEWYGLWFFGGGFLFHFVE